MDAAVRSAAQDSTTMVDAAVTIAVQKCAAMTAAVDMGATVMAAVQKLQRWLMMLTGAQL